MIQEIEFMIQEIYDKGIIFFSFKLQVYKVELIRLLPFWPVIFANCSPTLF